MREKEKSYTVISEMRKVLIDSGQLDYDAKGVDWCTNVEPEPVAPNKVKPAPFRARLSVSRQSKNCKCCFGPNEE